MQERFIDANILQAQLLAQTFYIFRAVGLITRQIPRHLFQGVQHFGEAIDRNSHELLSRRKEMPAFHAVSQSGDGVIYLAAQKGIDKEPSASDSS